MTSFEIGFHSRHHAYVLGANNDNDSKLEKIIEAAIRDRTKKLEFIDRDYIGSVPDYLKDATFLTSLNLSCNKLSGSFPVCICSLKFLTILKLGTNQFEGPLPNEIGKLAKLEEFNVANNRLNGKLPEELQQLKALRVLNLSNNRFNGSIPLWLNSLQHLSCCDLYENDFSGVIPPGMFGYLKVSGNPKLMMFEVNMKPIESGFDVLMVVMHIVLGYADFVSDIFAILEMYSQQRIELMTLNVLVLALNVFLDSAFVDHWYEVIQSICQIHILLEGIDALEQKHQTHNLLRSKRIDAICRSIPSMLIQAYTLLTVWESLDQKGVAILIISILLGLGGASATLAALDPSSGKTVFSGNFVIFFAWYTMDLMAKVLCYSMLFASIKGYGFFLLAFDWYMRFGLCWSMFDSWRLLPSKFALSLTIVGSDNLFYCAHRAKQLSIYFDYRGFVAMIIVTLVSLFIFNLKSSEHLQHLRDDNVTSVISSLLCIGTIGKLFMISIFEQYRELDEGRLLWRRVDSRSRRYVA
jgi:uncharacterized membrane protein YwzB